MTNEEPDILETLRGLLELKGITTTYTDAQLNEYINYAKSLCDIKENYMSNDYEREFNSDMYITQDYPLMDTSSVQVTIDGEPVTPHRITDDGIIYFGSVLSGVLEVVYPVGLTSEDILMYIVPLCAELIVQQEKGNINSINEGDISISYDLTSNSNTSINSLIDRVRYKYSGRVAFI